MSAVAYPVREQWVAPRADRPARRRARTHGLEQHGRPEWYERLERLERPERLERLDARVYRRRRVVILFMLVAAALVAAAAIRLTLVGSGGGALTTSGSSGVGAASPVSGRVYVVRTGDSLWSIVHATGRGGDPRPEVDRLARQLQGRSLRPGRRLLVP